jgi:2-keto-myo-inositol isomerase
MLSQSITAAGAAAIAAKTAEAAPNDSGGPFRFCLNTSTIRGQKLSLAAELQIAARAGYQAVEPWVNEVDQYVADGGSLADLRRWIADLGLEVASLIGFAEWIVDDEARRAKGLAEAARIMDLAAEIGCGRIAAPPAGVSEKDHLDIATMAQRYRALLELGDKHGVVPQLELWGFARVLSRLGDVAAVAIDAAHPRACILADAYHLYKGGSDAASLRLLNGAAMHVFHINDYPAKPPRAEITDAQRVFPGDGVAPLATLFRTLRDIGYRGVLSLEVFNREYWTQDALLVARLGLEKTRDAVAKSLA